VAFLAGNAKTQMRSCAVSPTARGFSRRGPVDRTPRVASAFGRDGLVQLRLSRRAGYQKAVWLEIVGAILEGFSAQAGPPEAPLDLSGLPRPRISMKNQPRGPILRPLHGARNMLPSCLQVPSWPKRETSSCPKCSESGVHGPRDLGTGNTREEARHPLEDVVTILICALLVTLPFAVWGFTTEPSQKAAASFDFATIRWLNFCLQGVVPSALGETRVWAAHHF